MQTQDCISVDGFVCAAEDNEGILVGHMRARWKYSKMWVREWGLRGGDEERKNGESGDCKDREQE